MFRLKGKGMPDVHHPDHHGDLYVKVMVAVPVKLTEKQRELLKQFTAESGETVSPKESISEKIKKVFK